MHGLIKCLIRRKVFGQWFKVNGELVSIFYQCTELLQVLMCFCNSLICCVQRGGPNRQGFGLWDR